jgi:hypothetical protein
VEHPASYLGLKRVCRHRPAGLYDHDRFVRVSRGRCCERGDTARTDARHPVHDALDVLGKIIATADDDHLLSAATDEKLSVGQIPKVARGEPAFSNNSVSLVLPAHVAAHHGRSGHEDLADNAFTNRPSAVVDHAERVLRECAAATDEARSVRSCG